MWGATDSETMETYIPDISIHAPRVGRDTRRVMTSCSAARFQSTRPVWGATRGWKKQYNGAKFQSTRPVWGATAPTGSPAERSPNFNPRAPCGARHDVAILILSVIEFQSTRPVWGATPYVCVENRVGRFQSTRPVWGATKA